MERITKSMQDALNGIADEGLRQAAASLGARILQRNEDINGNARETAVQGIDDDAPEDEFDFRSIPPEKRFPAKEYHLPSWAENRRGVPNPVLRGALFSAIQGKSRRALKGELIATQKGVEIRFSGWQLDQADLNVWEQVLHIHMIEGLPLGVQLCISARRLLMGLGLSTGRSDYNWLRDSFRRLAGAVVEITYAPGMTYAGNMLDFWRDDIAKTYTLEVNPRLAGVYAAGWTAIDNEQRLKFRRKPLASWLHRFFSSHAKPLPLKVAYLYRLSGSHNKNIRDFKYQLKIALEVLVDHGAIKSFRVDGDVVRVEVFPSNSQQRHLERRNPALTPRDSTDAAIVTG